MVAQVAPATKMDAKAMLRVAACMLVSVSEGFDLASAGLSGPTLIADLALSRSQLGLTVTALMTGFLIGAWGGGVLGDRYGRRRVMLSSMALIALFCLIGTQVQSLTPMLLVRFMSGIGLGGVMPNMLALAAESVPPAARSRAVTLANCGGSIGAISAALLLAVGGDQVNWRTYLAVGAVLPVIIIPIVWLILPESKGRDVAIAAPAGSSALLGPGRSNTTLLLWLACFLTSGVYYGFGNWAPILLGQRGLTPSEIGVALMMLSLAAMVGALFLATLFDRGRRRTSVLIAYVGMIVALPLFTIVSSAPAAMASMASLGVTVFGGQLLLYAVVAGSYLPENRSAALGAAVAAGRLGAIVAPLGMGVLLDHAVGPQGVVLMLIPLVVVAGAAALWVARKEPIGA